MVRAQRTATLPALPPAGLQGHKLATAGPSTGPVTEPSVFGKSIVQQRTVQRALVCWRGIWKGRTTSRNVLPQTVPCLVLAGLLPGMSIGVSRISSFVPPRSAEKTRTGAWFHPTKSACTRRDEMVCRLHFVFSDILNTGTSHTNKCHATVDEQRLCVITVEESLGRIQWVVRSVKISRRNRLVSSMSQASFPEEEEKHRRRICHLTEYRISIQSHKL